MIDVDSGAKIFAGEGGSDEFHGMQFCLSLTPMDKISPFQHEESAVEGELCESP
jgi:hypothetical protein